MKVKSRHRGLLRLNFSPQGSSLFLGVADKHKVRGQRSEVVSLALVLKHLSEPDKALFLAVSLEVVCSCNLVNCEVMLKL